MRVYEIAKEVGIPNKDLITKIRALGLEVNNHMSSLDADDVARIKKSLEKEKSGAAPVVAQKLSTRTVLRRRSTGDKGGEGTEEKSVERAPVAAPVPPVIRRPPPAPVVARPVVVEHKPEPVKPVVVEAPRHVEAPKLAVAEGSGAIAAPVEAKPAVVEATKPVVVEKPVEAAKPAPVVEAKVEAPKPVIVEKPVEAPKAVEAPAVKAPVVEAPKPVAAVPVAPPPRAAEPSRQSRVIVAGPQVVGRVELPQPRNQHQQHHYNQPQVEVRRPTYQQAPVAPEPPASTPLPPRIVPVRADRRPCRPRPRPPRRSMRRSRPAAGSRPSCSAPAPAPTSARARRPSRRPWSRSLPSPPMVVSPQPPVVARDPSRPAVGSIIALPPRIKITERSPVAGRPPPGAAPVQNAIRGRFAAAGRGPGGPRGPGGRPGSHDFGRKKLPLGKKGKQTQLTTPAEHKRVIRIEDSITVADLARNMGVKAPEVLKKLWGMGMTGVNINAAIDFDTAQILANEFAYEVQNVAFKEDDLFAQSIEEGGDLVPRSPVVTVMGHVDHGKTSLLDSIRKARVAAGESGGITQHVAAYKVAVKGHGDIVFLDTPGHEAFTEMRARGAQATDIVVLVVAANDGVMPQTLEALAHAKDAKVSIIVAVNKIDLPDAQPERVKQQLADHGLIPEEWGGETIYVNVSALKGENIDKLLESIALTAEVLELKADPTKPATGLVIEARLDRNRGPMATVLVQEGTIRTGDVLICGRVFGKVRAMIDDRGNTVKEAGPSTPVEILGLDGVPDAGDQVNVAEDDKVAKQVVEHRRQQFRKRELASTAKVSLESMMERLSANAGKELKIVLKADVQGSAEALKAALVKLSTDKVRVNVIAAAVGGITESDVNLAKAGDAIILGFHVRPAGKSQKLAEQEGVDIRLYDIIYDALDEVRAAMAGLLAPIKREIPMGKAQVRDTFAIPKIGQVAGCMITDGKITRKAHLRLIRDAVQVYEGKVGSLRRFKDDVSEVTNGYECGIMIAGYNDVQVNDIIEAYEVVEEAAKL